MIHRRRDVRREFTGASIEPAVSITGGVEKTMMQTVRDPVGADELGVTLMHEHVFILTADVMANYGHEWWDEGVRVGDAIDKLRALKAAGVDTIVDCNGGRAGSLHPEGGADQRRGRAEHRRRHRALHVRRDPALPPLPGPGHAARRPRADDRHVRPGRTARPAHRSPCTPTPRTRPGGRRWSCTPARAST